MTVALTAAGYVLGAVVVTVLWGVHRSKEARQYLHPEFRPQPRWRRLALTAMIVGLIAGVVSAYGLATEIAKW